MPPNFANTIRRIVSCSLLIAAGLISSQVVAQSPLFQPLFEVLTHPRCLNCHTKTDFPRQGDERRRHAQLVVAAKIITVRQHCNAAPVTKMKMSSMAQCQARRTGRLHH